MYDLVKKKERNTRLVKLLEELNSPVVRKKTSRKIVRPHCILKINEYGSLIMQGYYKGRIVNVLIPKNGGSIRDQVMELPESTWGHAHEIVQEFILPKIDEIVTHLKVFGEYRVF